MIRRSRQERLRQVAEAATATAEVTAKISLPSPAPQRGDQRIALLTGVKLTAQRGWVTPLEALQHLCYPPERYSEHTGSGSLWRCACDALWQAHGIIVHEHPVGTTAHPRGAILGPRWWAWIEGTGNDTAEHYREQQGLWDWRHPLDLILELLRGAGS
jgi:hypothetical protein